LGVLVLVLVTANLLQETPYFLFLNPMMPPSSVDERVWLESGLFNRLGIFILGLLCIFLGLRRMELREKVL